VIEGRDDLGFGGSLEVVAAAASAGCCLTLSVGAACLAAGERSGIRISTFNDDVDSERVRIAGFPDSGGCAQFTGNAVVIDEPTGHLE
jgi:hypothetical protein